MTTTQIARPTVVKEILNMLERDTDDFQQWVDDRYKWTSPTGQRLSDYAGGVRSLVDWLKAEVDIREETQ